MASYHSSSVFLHLRAPGSISRPRQASEEITITAILVEFWPALCVPGVSFLYLFQVPLFSGGSQGQEVHGSHCCPSELLGARERGEISLPSHLMPQFSLLGQVDHTVKSGSRLGLGKHFIHEVVTGFPLSVLSPDSPLPQPFLHFLSLWCATDSPWLLGRIHSPWLVLSLLIPNQYGIQCSYCSGKNNYYSPWAKSHLNLKDKLLSQLLHFILKGHRSWVGRRNRQFLIFYSYNDAL